MSVSACNVAWKAHCIEALTRLRGRLLSVFTGGALLAQLCARSCPHCKAPLSMTDLSSMVGSPAFRESGQAVAESAVNALQWGSRTEPVRGVASVEAAVQRLLQVRSTPMGAQGHAMPRCADCLCMHHDCPGSAYLQASSRRRSGPPEADSVVVGSACANGYRSRAGQVCRARSV